jgi:hypothetical protein
MRRDRKEARGLPSRDQAALAPRERLVKLKKFIFPRGRVMDWRITQARLEESKLEKLYAELRAIDASSAALLEARSQSDQALLRLSSVTGSELAAVGAFRRFSVAEHTRLELLRADCSSRVAAQVDVVSVKRRDVRLLERLKQQRHTAWHAGFNREIDAQAEETHLAKWNSGR